MIKISRRTFLQSAVAASLYPQMGFTQKEKLRIGVVDWKLNLAANPEAVPMAAKLGFDGIQINFGYTLVDGRMPVDDPAVIARYLSLSGQHKIPIEGTSAGRLNANGLKNDPLGPKWVLDSIRLTKALNSNVLLLPFFGRSAIQTDEEKSMWVTCCATWRRKQKKREFSSALRTLSPLGTMSASWIGPGLQTCEYITTQETRWRLGTIR